MSITRYLVPLLVVPILVMPLLIFPITPLSAANKSQCQSKIFDRFVSVERTGHKLPNRKFDNELKERMNEFEIICPWQVTIDLNGDRKRDWAGLVVREQKYSLLAYVSTRHGFKSYVIKTYAKFPIETHFDYVALKEVALISSKKLPISNRTGFALVENRIGKSSRIYLWDGSSVVYFNDFFGNY